MRRLFLPTLAALAGLMVAAGPAQAVYMSFESDFTTWAGSDGTSTSPVSSSTGHLPGSECGWAVTYDGATGRAAPGWLTQGDIGGTPTAASFYHKIPPGNTTARARFSTVLPKCWRERGLENVRMRVDYGMKYAFGYHSDRGSIQITYPTNNGQFNAYMRVRHHPDNVTYPHTMIQPLRNGGSHYGVDTLYLEDGDGNPRYIADEWHDWSADVVYGEYADYGTYGGQTHWAYWNVYLDGEHLLFGGENGSPVFGGRTYSFRTFTEAVSGEPYIGLGELQWAGHWDFECDYVNFTPEPASLLLLAFGGLLMRRRRV